VTSIEAVGGYGQPIYGSQLESSFFYPAEGVDREFCRLEFSYDEKGRPIHEAALDKQGRMIFALIYAPTQVGSVGNVQRASVVGSDGAKVLSSFDIRYDARGYQQELRFLPGGEGTQMTFGATDIRIERDAEGRDSGETFLDDSGNPLPENKGFAGKTYRRDAAGALVETVFHDLNGKPVPSPDGLPAIFRRERDKWENEIAESVFDGDGKPTVFENGGYHRTDSILNEHGLTREWRYFDVAGQPTGDKITGCYAMHNDFDEKGNAILASCLNGSGALMNRLDTGYAKRAIQYDSYGRVVGERFFDRDGKPVEVNGCYGRLTGYDVNGKQIRASVCLDANGKANAASDLLGLAHSAHDETYDFARAFDLDQQVVQMDPTPAHHLDLEEAALTADRFDVCLAQAAAVSDSEFTESERVIRDSILLACQFGSGKKADARATAASLMSRVSKIQQGDWVFDGTRHYVQTSKRFRAGADAWNMLFESLQNGNGVSAGDALRELQPVLKN
jgi:hypothetical protein